MERDQKLFKGGGNKIEQVEKTKVTAKKKKKKKETLTKTDAVQFQGEACLEAFT